MPSPGLTQALDDAAQALLHANPHLAGIFGQWRFAHHYLTLGAQDQMYACLLDSLNQHLGLARTSLTNAAQLAHAVLRRYQNMRPNHRAPSPDLCAFIAHVLEPEADESMLDPCCGSGDYLVACADYVRDHRSMSAHAQHAPLIYGQDIDPVCIRMAQVLKLLYGLQRSTFAYGDVRIAPHHQKIAQTMGAMDIVICDPPLHSDALDWPVDLPPPFVRALSLHLQDMDLRRCEAAARPWLFGLHGLASLKPGSGRMALILPGTCLHGIGMAAQIRAMLLRLNWVDGVIRLPSWLFASTEQDNYLLICNLRRYDNRLSLFDASQSTPHNLKALLDAVHLYRIRRDAYPLARIITASEVLAHPQCSLEACAYPAKYKEG